MGFSVAAAAAILFAGAIVCFSVVMQAVDTANADLRDAQAAEDARIRERLDSRVTMVNGTANGTVVDLNLSNEGSSTIHVKSLDILLNGTVYSLNITTAAVDGSTATNLWAPGQTLRLVVAAAVTGPATLRLITDTGYAFVGTVN